MKNKRMMALICAAMMVCAAASPLSAAENNLEQALQDPAEEIVQIEADEPEVETEEAPDANSRYVVIAMDDLENPDSAATEQTPIITPTGSSFEHYGKVFLVNQLDGPQLAFNSQSGVSILLDTETGQYFKDLNKNGLLDDYEDWRLSTQERAEALVELMSAEDAEYGLSMKLALMTHGGINASTGGRFSVYRSYTDKGEFADQNNQIQAQVEAVDWGIPGIRSSDPRHTGIVDAGFIDGEDTSISQWPNHMTLAATFDDETMYRYGEIVAAEYRALGIQMQLGPQMDLITDPRWTRSGSSWTEDLKLNTDLAGAFIEAMQTDTQSNIPNYGLDEGWGPNSVAAMAKHWPSGGASEFGFEAHADDGKFAVYPGGMLEEVAEAFAEGAGFPSQYAGTSRQASSVMPSYTIATEQTNRNVGAGFDEVILQDLLRQKYEYDGMITTDWGIQSSRGWGLEDAKGYSTEYRILLSILSGMDQQGGYSNVSIMRAAYDMGVEGSATFGLEPLGEDYMNALVDASCVRILRIIFNLGMFENPYCDPEYAVNFVGSSDLNAEAYQTHKDSVVMVKNHESTLPIAPAGQKVYVPLTISSNNVTSVFDLDTIEDYGYEVPAVIKTAVAQNRLLTDAEKASAANESAFAILQLTSPTMPNAATVAQNLTYSPYTAVNQRERSIGYDWYHADGTLVQHNETPDESAGDYKSNRSLRGTTHPGTPASLALIQEVEELMGEKDVVFILNMSNPMVPSDFEPMSGAILIGLSTSPMAYMEIISGQYEPNGLLSVNMPINMDAVEYAYEDTPHDMIPYVDEDGYKYQFGFGLNWSGQIIDDRTDRYDLEEQDPGQGGGGEPIPGTSIKIDNAALSTIGKGETLQMTATTDPENATVYWESSTPTIATIDENGLLTAIKSGTVRITATTSNGLTSSVAVRVTA